MSLAASRYTTRARAYELPRRVAELSDCPQPDTTTAWQGVLPVGARIVLLLGACLCGIALHRVLPGAQSFALLTLAAAGLLLSAFLLRRPRGAVVGGVFVALDLAWVLLALHFTGGIGSPLAPLLYAVVVLACLTLSPIDTGVALSGAAVGLLTLAYVWGNGDVVMMRAAAGSVALLAAVTVTARWYLGWLDSERRRACATAGSLGALLQNSADTVLTTDPSWRILRANEQAPALLGISTATCASGQLRLFDDIVRVSQPKNLEIVMGRVALGQSVVCVPLEACMGDGCRRDIELTAVPFKDTDDGDGIHVVLRDVTEARSRQLTLARPGAQATVDEVVGTITHELNNPLAAIRLNAELATLATQTPELGDIIAQVDRCSDVIRSLRAYTTRRDGLDEPCGRPLLSKVERGGSL